MFKQKYHIELLHCQECANEIIEALEKLEFIIKVYIDYDNNDIYIESTKEIFEKDVISFANSVVNMAHSDHHRHTYLNNMQSIITEEYNIENIDCPNFAAKVEDALNKNKDIVDAKVNYINKKIIIKHLNNVEVYNVVSKIVTSFEKDAIVTEEDDHHNGIECDCHHHHDEIGCNCHHHEHSHSNKLIRKIIFIVGIIIFAFAKIFEIICEHNEYDYELVIRLAYLVGYILIAYDIILKSIKGILHKDFFNENLLMVVASIGALAINESFEGGMVVLLYKIGEFFQDKATEKSKNSIKELIEKKNDTVTLSDGSIKNVKDVNVGEVITVRVGEQIPLDGIIKEGNTNVDMKTLTGESRPVYIEMGDEILSGSVNLTRVINIEVTKKDTDSTISKVNKLITDATNQKAKSEQFITKFAKIYTPLVLIIALIVGIVQGIILKMNVVDTLNNVFSILVIACPCALVISIPLGYFAGIGRCSANGILVKGGNYIEALSNAKTFVFDKTGTITKGNFKVKKVFPVSPYTKEDILAIASSVEKYSIHPIATSIKDASNSEDYEANSINEISGAGLKATINNDIILVGNDKLMLDNNIDYIKNDEVGTVLYLSKNGEFMGSILVCDEIRDESYQLFKTLQDNNYRTIMLTGDSEDVAKDVSEKLGINEFYAKILPQEKYDRLKEIIKRDNKEVVYVGDGINDAPSLRRADVGIAMGGVGSDSAKECADIIIMNDDILKISDGIKISKRTKFIVWENIIFTLFVKLCALVISISGILSQYAMLVDLFADVGVCLICILNVLRILKYKIK